MERKQQMKFKHPIVITLTVVTSLLISMQAAEAFSLKKFLLAPITCPLRYIGDVIFEVAECIYMKRTL
jgi:hypothetical protein